MTNVEKIEQEVRSLSRDELAAFDRWFREYTASEWDRDIEEDLKAGKLDARARAALEEHRAGHTEEL